MRSTAASTSTALSSWLAVRRSTAKPGGWMRSSAASRRQPTPAPISLPPDAGAETPDATRRATAPSTMCRSRAAIRAGRRTKPKASAPRPPLAPPSRQRACAKSARAGREPAAARPAAAADRRQAGARCAPSKAAAAARRRWSLTPQVAESAAANADRPCAESSVPDYDLERDLRARSRSPAGTPGRG